MISRLLSFLLLLYLLGYAAFVVLLPKPADMQRTDGIVVLTGGPGRVARGLDLMANKKADRMLISGVERSVRPQELAAEYDADIALFECCIDLGRESIDTRSNATETARWLKRNGVKTVRLVTNDWHMPRAGLEFSLDIPEDVEILSDAVPGKASFRQLFKEYNKYLLRYAAVLVGI
ncbi:YdcF family protein [Allosphingosinicella flava]|uniref:YdcF family protein n=1 Tax=Allosphingosinicella flava TaxID=2771430 RepID=A0A7T2GIM7_9SPHN|nr:YdcF family protein [Sphingosinicella flava]QPQ54560.1 YdcF family protein [Sphingosinicella flava]